MRVQALVLTKKGGPKALDFFNRLRKKGDERPAKNTYTHSGTQADPWNLDRPLLAFSDADPWTVRDACEGVQIFGGIGSGKTSGSGAALARAFLSAGFGGLVCCAKPEERRLWERYARETGRSNSLVIVQPGGRETAAPWRFNFLDYELRRQGAGGGLTENIVNLLTTVVEIVEGKQGQDSDGGFWKRGMNELLRNGVDLLSLSGEPLTLDNVCRLVLDAPTDTQQPHNAEWRAASTTFARITAAAARPKNARETNDFDRAASYWLKSYPATPDKTRGGIVATFRGVADLLLHGLAWELLATDTNIVPEVTYKNGAVIVLDLSIQEYREVGRIVQAIWKTLFQQAILRRDAEVDPRPVFLWCDESQNFITPFDYEYQATARSARALTVYMTQNISNYHARLGRDGQAQADALLGLFQTKIFHAQSDHATNQYAADLIGQEWTSTATWNSPGQGGPSVGGAESVQYKLLPSAFTTLRKGGPANRGQVDAIIFQGGRVWSATHDTYTRVTFTQ
jgi:hypothetical protein